MGESAVRFYDESHIGKGHFSYAEYEQRMQNIIADLSRSGAYFDGVYCCPHTANDGCDCMKPLPGLIDRAVRDFNIDAQRSYIIGDMGATDMRLAAAVGANGVLVLTGVGQGSLGEFRHTWAGIEPAHVAENVLEAVKWIMCHEI